GDRRPELRRARFERESLVLRSLREEAKLGVREAIGHRHRDRSGYRRVAGQTLRQLYRQADIARNLLPVPAAINETGPCHKDLLGRKGVPVSSLEHFIGAALDEVDGPTGRLLLRRIAMRQFRSVLEALQRHERRLGESRLR